MARRGVNVLFLAGTFLVIIGVILHIVGTFSPSWLVDDGSDDTFGLFLVRMGGIWFGVDVDESSDKHITTTALCLIAIISSLFASFLVAIAFCCICRGRSVANILPILILVCFCGAGLLIFIAVIVYSTQFSEVHGGGVHFGYSFALSIVGGVLMIIGSFLAFFGIKTWTFNQALNQSQPVASFQQPYMVYQPQPGGGTVMYKQ